jgi:hypothetical protein
MTNFRIALGNCSQETMKYRPNYPYRPFKNIDETKYWIDVFVDGYNNQHLHSGIQYVTPNSRHTGRNNKILEKGRAVFLAAK